MTLTPEEWLHLKIYAAGVATPLVFTGLASWFVLWRVTWREGSSNGPTLHPKQKD
jgi:hypothetical protein